MCLNSVSGSPSHLGFDGDEEVAIYQASLFNAWILDNSYQMKQLTVCSPAANS